MRFKIIRRIVGVVVLAVLSSCQLEQPMDPGKDLFGDIFSFQQVSDTTLFVDQGTVSIDWGNLGSNPVGKSQGYEALSLIKFTDFSLFDTISVSDLDSVKMVFPILGGIIGETDTSTSIGVYEYLSGWDESMAVADIDTNQVTMPAGGTFDYPADLDTTLSSLSLISSFDVDLVTSWVEDTTSNNGVLLKATSDSVMLFLSQRGAGSPPLLRLFIGEEIYSVAPALDLGVFRNGAAPEPSDSLAVIEQALARRIAVRWEEIFNFDTLSTNDYYIHSARLTIPIDQANTRSPREEHPINIAVGSGDGINLPDNPTSITKSISDTASALVIESSSSQRFLRDYLQSIINGSFEADRPLVFYYTTEAFGVQYTTLLPKQASLDVIYSVVENE